jgi:DNA-binding MarR family transcriptional regulator
MLQNKILKSEIGLKLSTIGKMSKVFAIQQFTYEEHGITPEQFTVLATLIENDGMYQRQICSKTFKDRPNITRIVNILEKADLVKRNEDVNGRKIYKIYITEKGKQIYEKVLPTIINVWGTTVKDIPDGELEVLLKVLEKIRKNLSENLNIQM